MTTQSTLAKLNSRLAAAERASAAFKAELKKLQAIEQELRQEYDLATKDDILKLCIANSEDDLFVALCQRPIPRKAVKEKLELARELRDIAQAAGIDASPLIQHMDNPAQLLKTAITAAKTSGYH
ncbi:MULTISPECIES: hypothetical protein [Marinobacter]|uniref:Uncharacterized protein n=1 Tax=Marinobacter nauticus (strain ATCC 700491 / DSM 11845 / VT8) TaxID=351348 RepID=A1U0S9_MARN8|nr:MULTISPECIES: hypothetical protein [Marinobacter]ABM18598.1 hypothetical protein Maqu_1514 [Marinobacter nauticus VT8]